MRALAALEHGATTSLAEADPGAGWVGKKEAM